MGTKPLAEYNPRPIAFEILFNDKKIEDGKELLERKFDPHVSDRLFEDAPLETHLADLKRLYRELERKGYSGLADIPWEDLEPPEYVMEDPYLSPNTKNSLGELREKIGELDQLYERVKNLEPQQVSESDLRQIKEGLCCLLQRYEVQYIPTNVGSTALVYEAWKQGKLSPLGELEEDGARFDKLLSALLLDTTDKDYRQILTEIADNFDLDHPRNRRLDEDTLSNGKTWIGSPDNWKWYSCVESALVLKVDKPQNNSGCLYLAYYPLLIDGYWFAGVAFSYSGTTPNVDSAKIGESALPEIFNRKKYPKIYNIIKSVSDTLKIALREEALKQASEKLLQGKSKEDVFCEAVKDYFVCFNIRKTGESNDSLNTNRHLLYEGKGIQVYGPEWLSENKDKKNIIKSEIEGFDNGVYQIPGLYELVEEIAQTLEEAKDEGIEEQSQKFSHQAFGLTSMVWRDPEIKNLNLRSRAGLWHLKTLAQLLGKNFIEAEMPIFELDFPEWSDLNSAEIIQEIADLSLSHALERATQQRLARKSEDKLMAQKIRVRALQILKKRGAAVDEVKQQIGLSPLIEEQWPHWVTYTGFILCFYHVFWQAAFHAFRASCIPLIPLDGTKNSFLKVSIYDNEVHVLNAPVPQAEGVKSKPRDIAFFEDINAAQQCFKIETEAATAENRYWLTKIIKQSEE